MIIDNNMVQHINFMIKQIKAKSINNYPIYILTFKNIKSNYINEWKKTYSNLEVLFMDDFINEMDVKSSALDNFAIIMYAKFYILFNDIFKKYNRILYLDSDILIKNNLDTIFSENLYNCEVGCCVDGCPWIKEYVKNDIDPKFLKIYNKKFYDIKNNYYNAGMILHNMDILKNISIEKKIELIDLIKLYQKYKLHGVDQQVLNMFYNICTLDQKYNYVIKNSNLNSIPKDIVFVHFIQYKRIFKSILKDNLLIT
jgi:lipopolysaccharide biosynthesis glycosyltransferase